MVQKGGKKNSSEINKDLTRIEDLSEFLHQSDPGLEERFNSFATDSAAPDPTAIFEGLPDIPEESEGAESTSESTSESVFGDSDSSFEFLEENTEESIFDNDSFGPGTNEALEDDSILFEDSTPEVEIQAQEDEIEYVATHLTQEHTETYVSNTPAHISEKFEDVKTFAKNFSYGQVQGAGNPPYSIIVRHIKFKEDADHILDLLREFALINDHNSADTIKALEFGSLIIPQISEYCAIVLAHKLRRFDLDLEVGLSDEIHPSKEAEGNPRGLLKKESLKQNRSESLKFADIDNSIKDIIISTTTSIPGFVVNHYIGVQTTFSIVEESELEKLQFVQKSEREKTTLFDYDAPEVSTLTSEKAFRDYQNSFLYIYEDLTQQLKQKAFTQKANALLGLSFQLSPLQFERAHNRINAYQITCSATLAVVTKENS
jgi:hypothetical protein